MAEQIFAEGKLPRIPHSFDGIQVNYCQNSNCKNFGVPASQNRKDPNYKITGIGKNESGIQCKSCGRITSVKSNIAIHEELTCISAPAYLSRAVRHKGYSCPNTLCKQYLLKVSSNPKAYLKRGKTSSGNQKLQCKSCRKMFAVGSIKYRERVLNLAGSHELIMKNLVNFSPLNRLCEIAETDMKSLYRKIDLIHEKCELFSRDRELQLPSMSLDRMQLSTDRQEYIVNWTHRSDKRTTQITAIATSDNGSGYAFGLNANFDERVSMYHMDTSDSYQRDLAQKVKAYHRCHARVWTPDEEDVANSTLLTTSRLPNPVFAEISDTQQNSVDDRNLMEISFDNKIPSHGALVHSEYTQYAHFLRLSELIGHAGRLVFYTDLESGISNAINLAFQDKIAGDTAHHIFVKYDKTLTNDEREALSKASNRQVKKLMKMCGYTRKESECYYVSHALLEPTQMKGVQGTWYKHPIDRINECNKYISFVKDIAADEWGLKVDLMQQASTYGVDSLFQQIRRRISMLERPISSASKNRRIWAGSNPYNPEMVNKLLQIFRTYYNFCLKSKKDKRTPAERLSLAKGCVRIRDIIG